MGALNLKKMERYRPSWPWRTFQGSRECISWNFKDLLNLEATMKFVKDFKAGVQAGGNLGLFPKRMAEIFKTVYTFEPDPILFEQMLHNAPERNIVSKQAALGCVRDPVKLACNRRDGTGRPIHEGLTHVAGAGDIPQVLIDDLKLKHCGLIYLDIEGYELNALKGAVETIERCRPVIAIEVNSNIAHYDSSKQELREWVMSQGYVKKLRQHGDDIWVPT